MPRRNVRSSIGRMQKFVSLQSLTVAQATTVYLPLGTRLHSVRGANSGADTYSFGINVQNSTAGGTTQTQSTTYTGIANGRRVSLMRDYPFLTNTNAAPTSLGAVAISITGGADSPVEVYYSSSTPTIDLLHSESLSPTVMDDPVVASGSKNLKQFVLTQI